MQKKIYILVIVVLFLCAIMVAQLLFGNNSIPRQQQVQAEINNYKAQIDSLENLIESHKQTIERLKTDSLYKEEILRTRYGMSRKDEKVFQMVK